jgi:hypothetical protein
MDYINDQFIEFDTVEETMAWLDAQKRIVTLMEHFHSEPVWALDPDLWEAWSGYTNLDMINNRGWKDSRLHAHWAIPRKSDPFYQKFLKFTGKQWREKYMDGKNLIIDFWGNVCTMVWEKPVKTSEDAMARFRTDGDPIGQCYYKWFNWKKMEADCQKAGTDPMTEFLSQIDFHRAQLVNYFDVFVKSYEKFTKTLETTLSGMSYISNGT